jgi:hypothetical protein
MRKPSEKAVEVRDKLNALTDELLEIGDQEAHILACCIAVAVEELEKHMYGDWTPSVAPYRQDKAVGVPFNEGEDGDDFVGPAWNRRKKTIFDRMPTLKRLKDSGVRVGPVGGDLNGYGMDDWDRKVMRPFRLGDRGAFIRAIRLATGATLREIHEYANCKIAANPLVWGIDTKDGDKCPICGSDDIEPGPTTDYEFWCRGCKTQWGASPF